MSVRVKPFEWRLKEDTSFHEWEARTAIGVVLVWELNGRWWYDLNPYNYEEDGVGEFDTEAEAKQKCFEHYQFLMGDQLEPDDVYDKIAKLADEIESHGATPSVIVNDLRGMIYEHH